MNIHDLRTTAGYSLLATRVSSALRRYGEGQKLDENDKDDLVAAVESLELLLVAISDEHNEVDRAVRLTRANVDSMHFEILELCWGLTLKKRRRSATTTEQREQLNQHLAMLDCVVAGVPVKLAELADTQRIFRTVAEMKVRSDYERPPDASTRRSA